MREMTPFFALLIPFLLLLLLYVVYWVCGFFIDEEPPLPTGRILVRQGNRTFFCDSMEEVEIIALRYPDSVTQIIARRDK